MTYEPTNDDILGIVEDELRWKQEQQRDMEALERAALKALEASQTRPLTVDEQMALAYAAGVANEHYKEIRK